MLSCSSQGPIFEPPKATVALYPFWSFQRAIDLQGRRLCQILMLCLEGRLQLATTALVSIRPKFLSFHGSGDFLYSLLQIDVTCLRRRRWKVLAV